VKGLITKIFISIASVYGASGRTDCMLTVQWSTWPSASVTGVFIY